MTEQFWSIPIYLTSNKLGESYGLGVGVRVSKRWEEIGMVGYWNGNVDGNLDGWDRGREGKDSSISENVVCDL